MEKHHMTIITYEEEHTSIYAKSMKSMMWHMWKKSWYDIYESMVCMKSMTWYDLKGMKQNVNFKSMIWCIHQKYVTSYSRLWHDWQKYDMVYSKNMSWSIANYDTTSKSMMWCLWEERYEKCIVTTHSKSMQWKIVAWQLWKVWNKKWHMHGSTIW